MRAQDILLLLQSLPTRDWGTEGSSDECELLLAHAYSFQCMFERAPSHLSPAAPLAGLSDLPPAAPASR